ncbi:MAG TPA: adenosylmethionine decarboxylase [Pirellulales bacterium]|nr:adenosylmethionine decarboxylase [Pirellulales bacterium]
MDSRLRTSWFGKLLAPLARNAPRSTVPIPQAVHIGGAQYPCGEHEFFGRHLVASYVGCDPGALADHRGLVRAVRAAIKASGATLLDELYHEFSPSGMTAVLLLAESHASIHTYPEHQACFVDLFTCGRTCSAERFDAVLREHLRPAAAHRRIVLRHAGGMDDVSSAYSDDWPVEWAA